MVSFICDHCQETVKKPKADNHVQRCYPPSLSCVDCSQSFTGSQYRSHFSCISEAEKYQKSAYNAPKKQQQQQQQRSNGQPNNKNNNTGKRKQVDAPAAASEPVQVKEPSPKKSKTGQSEAARALDALAAKQPGELSLKAFLKELQGTMGADASKEDQKRLKKSLIVKRVGNAWVLE
ncbi:hypothetical protein RI367_001167 [Sorochytrium milnesiophthora]